MTQLVDLPKFTTTQRAEGWFAPLLCFGLALLALGVAFWTTYHTIVSIWWRSGTFTHGFVIVPIVAYLIWLKRAELAVLTPTPEPKAIVFVLGAALFWLLGHTAEVAVAEHLAAVAMVPALAWVVFGTTVVRRLAFPLAYLIFAVPMGEFLVPTLQDITAVFSVWALQVTGIPVYWEGRFFYIPSGSFEVAEACSGVRYLIASLALGTLYAYLIYSTLWRRLVFVAISVVVPIVANGLRAYGIVMLAHLSDYQLAVGVDHLIYGWMFFGVVIFALFWAGTLFREKSPDNVPGTVPETAWPLAAANARAFGAWTLLAAGLAVSAPVTAAWLDAQRAQAPAWQPELPAARNGWDGPHAHTDAWQPQFVGAVERRGEYRKDGHTVQVYLAYYPVQNEGAELINGMNKVFDDKQARRLTDGNADTSLPNGKTWQVHATQVSFGDSSRLIWHWYEVDGDATTNLILAKAYEVRGRLSASNKGSSAWVLSTSYELTAAEAEAVLAPFVADMLPALQASMQP